MCLAWLNAVDPLLCGGVEHGVKQGVETAGFRRGELFCCDCWIVYHTKASCCNKHRVIQLFKRLLWQLTLLERLLAYIHICKYVDTRVLRDVSARKYFLGLVYIRL